MSNPDIWNDSDAILFDSICLLESSYLWSKIREISYMKKMTRKRTDFLWRPKIKRIRVPQFMDRRMKRLSPYLALGLLGTSFLTIIRHVTRKSEGFNRNGKQYYSKYRTPWTPLKMRFGKTSDKEWEWSTWGNHLVAIIPMILSHYINALMPSKMELLLKWEAVLRAWRSRSTN